MNLDELKATNTRLTADISKLTLKADDLATKLAAAEALTTQLQTANADLTAKLTGAETTNADLTTKLATATTKVEELTSTIAGEPERLKTAVAAQVQLELPGAVTEALKTALPEAAAKAGFKLEGGGRDSKKDDTPDPKLSPRERLEAATASALEGGSIGYHRLV